MNVLKTPLLSIVYTVRTAKAITASLTTRPSLFPYAKTQQTVYSSCEVLLVENAQGQEEYGDRKLDYPYRPCCKA